jgi:hypothetical protein
VQTIVFWRVLPEYIALSVKTGAFGPVAFLLLYAL